MLNKHLTRSNKYIFIIKKQINLKNYWGEGVIQLFFAGFTVYCSLKVESGLLIRTLKILLNSRIGVYLKKNKKLLQYSSCPSEVV